MGEIDRELIMEEIVEEKEEKPLIERENYIFLILFYFLGTVCFIPHNFYVTANEYWMYKFRNSSQPFNVSNTIEKTTLQKSFTAYTGIAGNVGTVTFLFVTILCRNKIALQTRIIGGMFSLLLFFSITLLFIFVDTDSWQTGYFAIALGISGLFGASTSVLLVSLFQLAYRFPPRCLAAQLAGQSLCGIFAAIIQVVALGVASSVQATAALYYAIAIMLIAGVMVAYILVLKMSAEFQIKLVDKPVDPEETAAIRRPKLEVAVIKRVLKKMILLNTALVLCVGNTGILHAGLTSLIESSGKGTNTWSNTYFVPVCVFFSYNTFEFVGREASNYIPMLRNKYIIFGTSLIRLALFPLILLSNLQPRHHLPVVFHSDAYFIVYVILLALSGGYILNIAVIVLPQFCEPEEKAIGTLLIVMVMIVFAPIFSILSGVFVNVL